MIFPILIFCKIRQQTTICEEMRPSSNWKREETKKNTMTHSLTHLITYYHSTTTTKYTTYKNVNPAARPSPKKNILPRSILLYLYPIDHHNYCSIGRSFFSPYVGYVFSFVSSVFLCLLCTYFFWLFITSHKEDRDEIGEDMNVVE